VPAPIVRDHAETFRQKIRELRNPVVGRERPAVVENEWLPASQVGMEELGAVPSFDESHVGLLVTR
jgi:hypothetical protein